MFQAPALIGTGVFLYACAVSAVNEHRDAGVREDFAGLAVEQQARNAAASGASTCFLQRNAFEINRMRPLEPEDRPADCPNRADYDPLLPS